MSSYLAYVDGRFVPMPYAKTHITDRGYQFADAAYEVVTYINGIALDMDAHLVRLHRTLDAMKINFKMSDRALKIVMRTLLERNNIQTGSVYLQISRGVAPRAHIYPDDMVPTVVMTCARLTQKALYKNAHVPLKVKTMADKRHLHCDLKTVGLMPNILALRLAREEGFDDAIFIDDKGHITEGTSWNFWCVSQDNIIKTRFLDERILHGITRQTLLGCAKDKGYDVVEGAISYEELKTAKEAFATSATKFVRSISVIDDIILPASYPIADSLRDAYMQVFFGENIPFEGLND